MLEYLTYKKIKKNRAEKAAAAEEAAKKIEAASSVDPSYGNVPDFSNDASRASGHQHRRRSTQHSLSSNTPPLSPVLDHDDEAWLQSILEDDGPAPPLPPRINTPQIDLSSASESEIEAVKALQEPKSIKDKKKEKKDKEKEKHEKQPNRLTALFTRHKKPQDGLKPEDNVAPLEAEREEQDLGNVLDRLNLQAKNNKIISLSNESSELLSRFTQVFKDLANGVPTAYGDLASLVEDRDGAINRGFEKLPSSFKKLVTQLPDKLTSSLAPELLAAAAESQGLKANTEKGFKDAAIDLLKPSNLTDLVTKPGAVVGMLKAIVNALKVRWPAFIGTNVIWSVALFLLMFVLWYCHKRGREVRLEREKSVAETPIDGSDRIEELPDDPLLPGPEAAAASHNADRAILGDPVSPLSEPSPIHAVVEQVSPEEPVRRR
ncbi:RING-like domain containing protein [Fusarium agapanthi]|uniref:RING-like domain containing protein n=1 Tax=Fusarium agapanthi TaxID=1803897 RepID=A0A9P5B853_9HYPO|nr:RING-like domain containing protein [Fusarium agapanthi]